MLPTFKSWTVHDIIEYLTLGQLSSLRNIYRSTTAYFFDPPCIYRRVPKRETPYSSRQFANSQPIKKIPLPLCSKFAAKYLLNIPPHLICVATLPCERLTSENEQQSETTVEINVKWQGTVVTYLMCGGLSVTKLRKVYCWVRQWKLF